MSHTENNLSNFPFSIHKQSVNDKGFFLTRRVNTCDFTVVKSKPI